MKMQGMLSVGLGAATAVTAAAATYYLATRPEPVIPVLDLNDQSVELKDGSRISKFVKDEQLMEKLYDDVSTTYEGFQRGIRISNDGPCLGDRTGPNKTYRWISYQQVYDRAQAVGSGLIKEGLLPQNDTFVGIYSINRIEWVLTEQACTMYSMVSVPLYDTLGTTACSYIINQTGITHVVCDKPAKAQILLNCTVEMPSLKCIILMEQATEECKAQADKCGVMILQFDELEAQGKKNLKDPVPPKPSDVLTICYTSGTTGDPKGVVLTHNNMISNMAAVTFIVLKGVNVTPQDVHMSYLPLAHMFERGLQTIGFMHGIQVGFFQGDVKLLTEDLQALKPTILITVPRLLNRIYDKVYAGVQHSKIKSTLLKYALAAKMQEVKSGIIRNNSIWDKLVFSKVQNTMGGRVKIMITGSAPLEPKVLAFVRAAFGCIVMEGYGQTEATAGLTFNIPGETEPGHVGPPLPCCKVKLVDVPEMNYFAKNNQGEICGKGPNCFSRYYKNKEKTEEAIDQDGWLHTGDIGEWLPNGVLTIIDRKKNIFKLAQGEYVAAEKIENVYMRSEYVAQAFVEGDSLKPYLMGVMVPDPDVVSVWAKTEGLPTDMTELCTSKKLKDLILNDILEVGKRMGLKTFEQVKDIHLHPELFSVENDLLTPTFKSKRPNLRSFFKTVVVDLYRKHKAL